MVGIKDCYLFGKLQKADYIHKMYEKHSRLYEYSHIIKETNICKIVIEDESLYMVTRDRGIKLYCKEFDERIVPIEIINFNDYEKEELNMVDNILDKLSARSFVDIGANIGYISMYHAKKYNKIKFYAFEPVKATFDILSKNVSANAMDNIFLYNIGISNEKKEAELYYYPEGSGNTSLKNLSGREDVVPVPAMLDTLDNVLGNIAEREKVDFIKCDVEGAEYFALSGAENILKTETPVVFVELLRKWSARFGYIPNDVIKYMCSFGYSCFVIHNGKLKEISLIDDNTVETNFLFVHKSKFTYLKELIL